jgi:signal transduction histidine kinase
MSDVRSSGTGWLGDAIGLDGAALDCAFPCHITLDSRLRILRVGPVLRRLVPSCSEGSPFSDSFEVRRPTIVSLDFDSIAGHRGSLFLIAARDRPDLLLKWQVLPVAGERLVFLGGPWIPDTATLVRLGLTIRDYALHDAAADYLILVQAQSRALDEAQSLARELREARDQLQASYADLERKVEDRTVELRETLQYQTATSDVLKVINRATFDLNPVLKTLIETAARLCHAEKAFIYRLDGEAYRLAVGYGLSPKVRQIEEQASIYPSRGTLVGRVALEKQTIHVADALADPDYEVKAGEEIDQVRTMLGVPLQRKGTVIGVVTLARGRVDPFTDRQIELVTTFADQAVIAIENVRMLTELQAQTRALQRSVEEMKALGEVGQAVSSTLDLQTVLGTIAARAVPLSGADGGAFYAYEEASGMLRLQASYQLEDELVRALTEAPIHLGEAAAGRAAVQRRAVQMPDIDVGPRYPLHEIVWRLGYRALLAVPLLNEERIIGALTVLRRTPGAFSEEVVRLIQAFATQSALAIQNANLFHEIEETGRQLAVASRHKSEFLANMSHELRTPLNAILGYTELIQDNIYGQVPDTIREILDRVQNSGRHLLGLINAVLDLSKIEAGQLTLSIVDYSMKEVVQTVVMATEALVAEKKLALRISISEHLPRGEGDERRITQVLLNLVGNAIKFTVAGEIAVHANAADGAFQVSVSDTGPGIAAADQQRIFEEFQQVDSSSTREKGGTGLGLSISKKIIELHGGRIWMESELGRGSTFRFTLPVRSVSRRVSA